MEIIKAVNQLRNQGQAITRLVENVSDESACWQPSPEDWSILEVLNHLVDEEILDFRQHLDHILHTPDQPWPKIDPQGWVIEKGYNRRNFADSLENFKAEREKSIAWLMTLTNPNWQAFVTLTWGQITAGDMLASWLAHDLLHLRQLNDLKYQITASECHPYSVQYAGEW